VQWAKHLGANVIGTVSTEAKARTARASGADHVVRYAEQDFVAEVKRITENRGADLIIDGVGRTTFKGDLEAVATRGHIVIFGAEVLQLCSHPMVGWQDAPPGIFGLWSIQVAPI